jgi:hypothetical protein
VFVIGGAAAALLLRRSKRRQRANSGADDDDGAGGIKGKSVGKGGAGAGKSAKDDAVTPMRSWRRRLESWQAERAAAAAAKQERDQQAVAESEDEDAAPSEGDPNSGGGRDTAFDTPPAARGSLLSRVLFRMTASRSREYDPTATPQGKKPLMHDGDAANSESDSDSDGGRVVQRSVADAVASSGGAVRSTSLQSTPAAAPAPQPAGVSAVVSTAVDKRGVARSSLLHSVSTDAEGAREQDKNASRERSKGKSSAGDKDGRGAVVIDKSDRHSGAGSGRHRGVGDVSPRSSRSPRRTESDGVRGSENPKGAGRSSDGKRSRSKDRSRDRGSGGKTRDSKGRADDTRKPKVLAHAWASATPSENVEHAVTMAAKQVLVAQVNMETGSLAEVRRQPLLCLRRCAHVLFSRSLSLCHSVLPAPSFGLHLSVSLSPSLCLPLAFLPALCLPAPSAHITTSLAIILRISLCSCQARRQDCTLVTMQLPRRPHPPLRLPASTVHTRSPML